MGSPNQTKSGGIHNHRLDSKDKTSQDGVHKHLFFVSDRLIMSETDGNHFHEVDSENNQVIGEDSPVHTHKVLLRTESGEEAFETSEGTPHTHELQVESTTVSGLHTHLLKLGENQYISLLPSDLIKEIESNTQKSLKGLNVKDCIEGLTQNNEPDIKNLKENGFFEILAKAVLAVIFKSLDRLNDGLKIQSLILSKERFSDIGLATRFVLDQGLPVKASEDRDNVFSFVVQSSDKFQVTTLQRIRLTEGVEAVIGFLVAEEIPTNQEGKEDSSLPQDPELKELSQKLNSVQSFYNEDKNHFVKKLFHCPILKSSSEKRLVTGPLLIPEKIDLQNEIISHEEIETAAHNYMTKLTFQKDPEFLKQIGLSTRAEQGFMHADFERKIAVVESYIAPIDFDFNKRKIVAGTWMITVKVFDDEVWGLIKAGKIRGFSIGGQARLIEDTGKQKSLKVLPDFESLNWEAA